VSKDNSRETVAKTIISGIKKAHKSYHKLSNGFWLDYAPEYFLTCTIANELCTMSGNEYITLEHNVKDAVGSAGAISRGKLHTSMRSNGRSDIVLWYGNECPKAIVEVKTPLYSLNSEAVKDIERIEKVLIKNKDNNTFKYGIFAFYTSAKDNQKSNASEILGDYEVRNKTGRINGIVTKIDSILKHCDCEVYYSKSKPIEDSAWMAACILISPN
jgi:hypothetical protein